MKEIRDLVKDIEPEMSILDMEGECLYKLVEKYCPENCTIVEIGSWKGRSTIWLAKAAQKKGGFVYAVDPHTGEGYEDKTSFEQFRANVKRAGVEGVVVPIRQCSREAFYNTAIPEVVNFVFIDGNHEYMEVEQDFNRWTLKCRVGKSIIAFHDTIGYEGPRRVVSYILLKVPNLTPIVISGQVVAFRPELKRYKDPRRFKWYIYWKLYSLAFLAVHNLVPKPLKEVLKKW